MATGFSMQIHVKLNTKFDFDKLKNNGKIILICKIYLHIFKK